MRPFLLSLLCAASSLAQTTPYHSADTMRYREVTSSQSRMEAPGEVFETTMLHDATIALWFTAADTARAENRALIVDHTMGDEMTVLVGTRDALGLPFVLRFPPSGRVETVAAPQFPDAFDGVTDLTRQFDDYFLPLPDRPLGLGVTWADTTRLESEAQTILDVGTYAVSGDTTVAGAAAWIVTSDVVRSVRSEGEGPSPGTTMVIEQNRTERNRFVVSVAPFRMLSRVRTGTTAGSITISGGPRTMTLPTSDSFTNRIEWIAPSR